MLGTRVRSSHLLKRLGRGFCSDRPVQSKFWRRQHTADPQVPPQTWPALDQDLNVDVAIVGGGIVGLSTAHHLVQQGTVPLDQEQGHNHPGQPQQQADGPPKSWSGTVAVLEGGRIGESVTGSSLGIITTQLGPRFFSNLLHHMGAEQGRLCVRHLKDAQKWLLDTASEVSSGGGAGRSKPETMELITYAGRRRDRLALQHEAHIARKLRVDAEFMDEPLDIPVKNYGAVRVKKQAQLDPVALLQGMAGSLEQPVSLFEQSRVVSLKAAKQPGQENILTVESGDSTGEGRRRRFKVRARWVVLATHLPAFGGMYTKAFPHHIPVMAARLPRVAEAAEHGSRVSDQAYPAAPRGNIFMSGEEDASRVFRFTDDGRTVIAEGAPFRPGDTSVESKAFRKLEQWLRRTFHLRDSDIAGADLQAWVGQDLWTADRLPLVGVLAEHSNTVLGATGFGGWGLVPGALAGRVLTAHILGTERESAMASVAPEATKELPEDVETRFSRRGEDANETDAVVCLHHPLAKVLDPRRVGPLLGRIRGLIGNSWGWIMGRWPDAQLSRQLLRHLDELDPGSGVVLTAGGEHLAISRSLPEEGGKLQAVSAVCTHKQGIVAWNAVDATWDCPCHGSRYHADGTVLKGPASLPLESRPIPSPAEGEEGGVGDPQPA